MPTLVPSYPSKSSKIRFTDEHAAAVRKCMRETFQALSAAVPPPSLAEALLQQSTLVLVDQFALAETRDELYSLCYRYLDVAYALRDVLDELGDLSVEKTPSVPVAE